MVKKTLLSLAIAASTAGLTACNISSTSDSNKVATDPINAGQPGHPGNSTATMPIFSAANSNLPLINDLIFASASVTDGTASAGDTQPPVTTAMNSIEGASIVAPIDIDFTGALDAASLNTPLAVNIIKLRNAVDDPRIDALDLSGSILPIAEELWGGNPIAPTGQPIVGTDFTVSYLSLDDGSSPVLRINLLKPLEPKTKYIVALTTNVKDSAGEAIEPSFEYAQMSGNEPLPASSLAPVRGAVQGWESIAGGYLAAASSETMGQDDVVLSYAFTTGGTTEVLTTIAAPQLFVEALASQPTTAESLYLAAIKGGAQVGGATEEEAEVIAFTDWMTTIVMPIVGADESLTIADPASPTTAELDAVRANATYQATIVGAASSGAVIAGITATLATPSEQDFELILSAPNTAHEVSTDGITTPVASGLGINFVQGQIELPVGLSAPAMTNSDALASGDAATIGGAVKLSYATDSVWSAEDQFSPPSDNMKFNPVTGKLTSTGVTTVKDAEGNITGYTGGMTNVTYRYPLAEFDQTEYAPVLMTVPSKANYTGAGGADCSGVTKFKTLVYVHGITADRTSSIGMATAMAMQCYVTIAMDLPLHGVAPIANDRNGDPADNTLLGFNVEQTGGFGYAEFAAGAGETFANMEERHRNIASQTGTNARVAMDFDGTVSDPDVDTDNGTDGTPALGSSGSFFINLGNMGRTRDNVRQAVVDLMHLNATIGAIDVDGDGTPDLDVDNVYLAGNSLGAIVASTFVAVNNQAAVQAKNTNLPKIQGVVLASPGASLPKMLENSPSFSTNILEGLQLAQGSNSLQKFESMLQAALNSADAINFASLLRNDDTPVLMYNMVGGGDCPAFDLATGVCGDGDKGDKIPKTIVQAFAGKYPPDHVVPNDDYFKSAETNPYVNVMPGLTYKLGGEDVAMQNLDSSKMALAGTIPLAEQMGLTQVSTTNIASATFDKKAYVPFEKGSHVTFVAKDDNATFTTMMTQMITFFGSAGAALQPGVTDGIAAEQAGYNPVAGE